MMNDTILNSDNYHIWNVRVKAALRLKGWWHAVDPGFGESLTPDQKDVDEKALSFIILSVSDLYLFDIDESKTAKEAWKSLGEIHGAIRPANKPNFGLCQSIELLNQLKSMKKTEDMKMIDYLAMCQSWERKIRQSGIAIGDNQAALFMLMGLLGVEKYEDCPLFKEKPKNLTTKLVKMELLNFEYMTM